MHHHNPNKRRPNIRYIPLSIRDSNPSGREPLRLYFLVLDKQSMALHRHGYQIQKSLEGHDETPNVPKIRTEHLLF
jgi:hypothetical protein